MSQLFINIIGHNASGKTTLAKKLADEFGLSRISGDDFRYFVRDHIRYFSDLDISYPSLKTKLLRSVTASYRLSVAGAILEAGQSLIFDGSGFTKADRKPIIDTLAAFPKVRYVIIQATLPEEELLQRLRSRPGNWEAMYHDIRKLSFEAPTRDEVEMVLEYSQNNYDEIRDTVSRLIS